MIDKAALRQTYKAQWQHMSSTERTRYERAFEEMLLKEIQLGHHQTVFLYLSMSWELNTWPIKEQLTKQGIRVCVPYCEASGVMHAKQLGLLTQHPMGFLQPSKSQPTVAPKDIDLIVVPALAFDKAGYRLGQGGGYYDRYLAHFSGPTIGACPKPFLEDSLPVETHDIPVSRVLLLP